MKGSRTKVDVGGVLQAGRELDVLQAVTIPEFISFRFPKPVDVALRLRRAGRGIELKGTIAAVAEGECARCLDDVRLPLYLEVHERFETASAHDPLEQNNVLVGDDLDVQDLVRQLIDSALPLMLLCTDDCAGLCTGCGRKRDGTCRCTHPE